MEHIVIIGGGFGGLSFLKKARKSNNKFTLIDKTNHHLFIILNLKIIEIRYQNSYKLAHAKHNTH